MMMVHLADTSLRLKWILKLDRKVLNQQLLVATSSGNRRVVLRENSRWRHQSHDCSEPQSLIRKPKYLSVEPDSNARSKHKINRIHNRLSHYQLSHRQVRCVYGPSGEMLPRTPGAISWRVSSMPLTTLALWSIGWSGGTGGTLDALCLLWKVLLLWF